MDVITLSLRAGQWVASYSGPHGFAVSQLFGATTLPTPFGAATPAESVLLAIRAMNPGVTVRLG